MSKEPKQKNRVVIESFIDLTDDPCFSILWDPESGECAVCGDFKACKKGMTSLTKEIDTGNNMIQIEQSSKGDRNSTVSFTKVKAYLISKGGVCRSRELLNYFTAKHGNPVYVKLQMRNHIKSKKIRFHKATKTFELLKEK